MNAKEKQIIMLIANGYESDEILKILVLSPDVLESYQKQILQKLNARTIPQAIYNYLFINQAMSFC